MVQHAQLGFEVALAWFCAANLAAAAALFASRPVLQRSSVESHPPHTFLAWRLAPALVALFATASLAIPAFVWLEPHGARETIGWTVRVLSLGGGLLLAAGTVRGWLAVRRSSRALRACAAGARRLLNVDAPMPAFVVQAPAAVMVLAGVFRPKLLISEQVVAALDPDELHVAVAHEVAHHRAWDNAKRRLLAFVPDVLAWTTYGREIEQRWHAAAELAADDAAAGGRAVDAARLASALVKVARLSADAPVPDYGCASFQNGQPVADRVRRLTGDGPGRSRSTRGGTPRAAAARLAYAMGAAALIVGAFQWPSALAFVHAVTELLVRLP